MLHLKLRNRNTHLTHIITINNKIEEIENEY